MSVATNRYQEMKSQGLCQCYRALVPGKSRCEECLKKLWAGTTKGICSRCGKNPTRRWKMCAACRKKNRRLKEVLRVSQAGTPPNHEIRDLQRERGRPHQDHLHKSGRYSPQ